MLKTPQHKVKIFCLAKLQSWGFHTKGPCYITVDFQRYWQKYFFVVGNTHFKISFNTCQKKTTVLQFKLQGQVIKLHEAVVLVFGYIVKR